jgi:hypothetical protein
MKSKAIHEPDDNIKNQENKSDFKRYILPHKNQNGFLVLQDIFKIKNDLNSSFL